MGTPPTSPGFSSFTGRAEQRPPLVAIVGGGTMGQAILRGAFDSKLLAPFEVVVIDPDAGKRRQFESWNVQTAASIGEGVRRLAAPAGTSDEWVAAGSGTVLLAVKPQSLGEVAREIGPELARVGRPVISILAGTPIAKLRVALGQGFTIVRAMPNTPARVRKGMTAICAESGVRVEETQFAYDLFASLGEVVRIREELMDAFTAVAGSGPAYLFYLAESLLGAAMELGFDRITADRMVRQTILGSSALLTDSSETPGALRAAVTSKGGTTEAAVEVLDGAGVGEIFVRAVRAGRDRGLAISKEV